jgi:hypothetical protein
MAVRALPAELSPINPLDIRQLVKVYETLIKQLAKRGNPKQYYG